VTEALAGCLRDPRQAGKVAHNFRELVQQRIFALALGYPDGKDARELADDPLHELLVDRDPVRHSSRRQPSSPSASKQPLSISAVRPADAHTTRRRSWSTTVVR